MWVRDVMLRDVPVVGPELSLREAAEHMRKSHRGLLVVGDGRCPHGVVTTRELVLGAEAQAQGYPVDRVGDIVSLDFIFALEDEALVALARRMIHAGVRRAIVVDGALRVLGVVSPMEMARPKPSSWADATAG